MAATLKTRSRPKKRATKVESVQIGGREGWRVISNGNQKLVVTSRVSSAAIKEAVDLYDGALARLAKR